MRGGAGGAEGVREEAEAFLRCSGPRKYKKQLNGGQGLLEGRGHLGIGRTRLEPQRTETGQVTGAFIVLWYMPAPAMVQARASTQEAATLPPAAGPCGGSVMGGRNRAFSLPDRLAISGSCAS